MQPPQPPDPIPAAPKYTIYIVLIFIPSIVISFIIAILIITAANAGDNHPSPASRHRIHRFNLLAHFLHQEKCTPMQE